ncbi:MAG: hypothetical protein RIB03_01095 [Henriciella sp.]|uniref:hypothetical protein n=1 Tax=Henriciella sp. TaxID=1968823 RepID=UPI00260CA5E7|nr:hypothetical protein [Henriciella sp.]
MPPEILYGIGALVLLGILAWAVIMPRLKSPKARAIREEAIREEYEAPDQYAEDQDKLAAKAEEAEKETRKQQ